MFKTTFLEKMWIISKKNPRQIFRKPRQISFRALQFSICKFDVYGEYMQLAVQELISYILSDSVWVNLSENMVSALIKPIRKAKRLFHVWVERFDQSQRTHQKQPCFR